MRHLDLELKATRKEVVTDDDRHFLRRIQPYRTQDQRIGHEIHDGIGVQSTETRGRGLGIHIMGYRAGIIGGQLTIDTPDQGGTLVECRCPSARRAGIEAADAGPGR